METAGRAAQVEKLKAQMMQVMGIKDPAEFQRVARDYCKEMAGGMSLPYFHRIFSKISKVLEKTREKFDKLSKEEKVSYALKVGMDDEEIVETFNQAFAEQDQDEKDITADRSSQKRNEGNAAFQKKDDLAALELYTAAAFSGKAGTDEGRKDMALGLANRSAVLFKLKRYEDCLEDIEAALYFEYPENMRYKLFDRQAKCFEALGQVSDSVMSYNRMVLTLKQSTLDKDKQDNFKKEVSGQLERLQGRSDQPRRRRERKCLIASSNKTNPQFSEAVEVLFKEGLGRHGRATRTIEAGEVLMQDTSVTNHLLCSTRNTHCTNCMLKIHPSRGVPSPLGAGVRFCSLPCLKQGLDTYHPVEAKIDIEKFFWNKKEGRYEETSGNILLTYRALTQKPRDFFLGLTEYMEVNPRYGVGGGVYEYSNYANIFNLEAHRARKTNQELISLSVKTAILLVMLRYGGYFGSKETPYGATMNKSEAHIANILTHIQEGVQYNLHTVDEVVSSKLSGIAAPELKEAGSAVFPTLLLLNHSCEPNTLRINANGNQVIMVAKRRIRQGEEVSDNYGIHHLSVPFEERQEALSRGFAFSCCCNACAKDYPRMKSLRYQLPETVEDKFEDLREEVKDVYKKGDSEACYRLSTQMIQLLESNNIVYPHRNYEMAALSLLSCLWTIYGNHH